MFIDTNMPQMSGVELTQAIRKFEKTANIKKTYIIGMKDNDDE